VISHEITPGRITILLVEEALGFLRRRGRPRMAAR
jgi:hypothetical protein